MDLALWLAPFFSQCFFLLSWILSNLPMSWFLSYEVLLPFLPNVPRAPLVAPSIPGLSLTCRWHHEEKTRDGAAQFILSKNVPIPSTSELWPWLIRVSLGWTSKLAGSADEGEVGVLGCGGWVIRGQKSWTESKRVSNHSVFGVPAWICFSWASQGTTKTEPSNAPFGNLLQNDVKHNTNKKE